MHRPPKDAPSTRFVSPCVLQRASPKLLDGKRGSWSVGGVCRGDITAARSASICPRVLALAPCIVFLSAARWQSSASRGGAAVGPRRVSPKGICRSAAVCPCPQASMPSVGQVILAQCVNMAASAAVPAAGEPGVPAMRGPVSSSSPASAWLPWASGLSTLPPLHPRSSPLRRQGSSHVETLPRQPFDSPGV